MKTKLFLAIAILAASAFGQTALTSTTVTSAITVNQQTFAVASTTGMTVGVTRLYIMDKGGQGRGELTGLVTALPTTTSVTVSRGATYRAPHVALSVAVIINSAQAIQSYDPVGSCTAANTLYTPWINQNNGYQWLCSTKTGAWVPGFNNPLPHSPTADVASVAGLTVVTSPLFHVTGTNAITGWTLPATFVGGSFCTIPDAAYTTTNATNIAIATTAVAGKLLCFQWSSADTKWYPTY